MGSNTQTQTHTHTHTHTCAHTLSLFLHVRSPGLGVCKSALRDLAAIKVVKQTQVGFVVQGVYIWAVLE